jgi:hypothetical protein
MAVEDSEGSPVLFEDLEQSPTAPGGRTVSIDQLIERWWQDHFPGSAIARDTQAWNVAHAAKETLKRLLVQARDKVLKGSI